MASRVPSSFSTVAASDGVPIPMKPAATWVSNSCDGAHPHARSRIDRSWSAACATMQPGAGEQLAERGGVDRQRVDQRDPVGPGDLDQREVRPVRALAVELGVERVARLVGEGPDELGQLRRLVDPEGFHGASLPACAPGATSVAGSGPGRVAAVTAQRRFSRTVASCSNDRSTAPWSSARWRTMTSVQPGRAEAPRRRRSTRSGPPTTTAEGSKPR